MQKTIIMLLVATLVLAGLAAAEPQPVDGGWHRSDEVPIEIETPTAAPTESDADAAATTVAESCVGLAVVWIAVILMRGGAKR
jgi:hypothetical protein